MECESEIADIVIGPTEIAVGLGILRFQRNRALESFYRLGPTLCLAERIAHVVIRLGVIGLEANHLPVSVGGFLITPELGIDPGRIAVGINRMLLQTDGLLISLE